VASGTIQFEISDNPHPDRDADYRPSTFCQETQTIQKMDVFFQMAMNNNAHKE